MNLYLIEPYNAHQKPPRKKHWTELAEEEALFIKTMNEQYAKLQAEQNTKQQLIHQSIVDEAIHQYLVKEQSAIKNNQNLALPQYEPQPTSQQVQDGQYATVAGAGGLPDKFAVEFVEVADFSYTPTSGIGPLSVSFTNLTPTPENDTFYWDFDSGSLTSVLASPNPIVYLNTGSYTITLQSTSSQNAKTSVSKVLTVNAPTLIAGFTSNITSGPIPLNVTFSNATTTYNGAGTLTYLWNFGSGSLTSTEANPTMSYSSANLYTVSLQVTESTYKLANKGTRTNYISAST